MSGKDKTFYSIIIPITYKIPWPIAILIIHLFKIHNKAFFGTFSHTKHVNRAFLRKTQRLETSDSRVLSHKNTEIRIHFVHNRLSCNDNYYWEPACAIQFH